jgi:polysaccharide biosynthesis transport protein
MDSFVELRQVVATLLSRWWILALGLVVGGLVGFGVSRVQTPIYEATTTINVGRPVATLDLDRQDLLVGDQLVLTYADLARRQPVLQGVMTALNLPGSWQQLRNQVRARSVENTQLLELQVRAGSAEMAQQIANTLARQLILTSQNAVQTQKEDTVAAQFARQRLERLQQNIREGQLQLEILETQMSSTAPSSVEKLTELQTELQALETLMAEWDNSYARLLSVVNAAQSTNRLAVVESAELNASPVQPRMPINVALASLVGLALAVLAILLAESWNTTIRTADDIDQSLGLATLGGITRSRGRNKQPKLVFSRKEPDAAVEEYRLLRSKLQYTAADWPRKVLLVTSLTPNEQNSLIVANLGTVMALAGYKTVVVDANLRQPRQHDLFQLPNWRGLTELLMGSPNDLNGYLQNTGVQNLQLLTAGGKTPYPAELLSSANMQKLLAGLTTTADVVLFDCAEATTFADAAALSRSMNGVLLTIEAGKVDRSVAQQVISNLNQTGANLVGAILCPTPGKSLALKPSPATAVFPSPNKVGGLIEETQYVKSEQMPTKFLPR